jgi:hypothetical protein
MSRTIILAFALSLLAGACFFELGELVETANSGGGSTSGDVGGGPASDVWWNEDFRQRAALTFSGASGALDDMPVPVFLDASRINYAETSMTGADLRFVDVDGTMLPYEIERWDPSGVSVAWVLVPRVDGATDRFWMYYGNPTASPDEDPTTLWNGYAAVYHLAGNVDDSANDNDGSINGMLGAVEGMVGPAYNFTGNENILIGDLPAFEIPQGTQATFEVSYRGGSGTLAQKEGCCIGWFVRLFSGVIRQDWRSGTCCNNQDIGGYDYNQWMFPSEFAGEWHHLVAVYDRAAGTSTLYVDGQERKQSPIDNGPSGSGQGAFRIGADYQSGNGWQGDMDEVRFAGFGYDATRAALYNLAARDQLLGYGSVETLP